MTNYLGYNDLTDEQRTQVAAQFDALVTILVLGHEAADYSYELGLDGRVVCRKLTILIDPAETKGVA